jgi:PRTRC genetic system protein E
MSLDGAITNLASWAGNTMMPTIAGLFFAGAVYRYSKGGQFEQLLYGGFASLMCSGMLRALEGFVQHAGPTSADGFWMATMSLVNWVTLVDADQIRVNIVPKKLKDGDNGALTTPLSVTGTAEDLDAELASTLVGYVGSHLQMKNTLEKAKAEMDAASKAAQAEARAKSKTPAKTAPPNSEVTQYAPTAKPAEPAKPAPQKPASLFDVPAPVEDEDDPTSDEAYTSEPEESEELDEAA